MANLSTLVIAKKSNLAVPESNLETGTVYSYSFATTAIDQYCTAADTGFCWLSPGAGSVVIETWGAGGSSSLMCCCGGSLPGNSGAYSCKVLSVDASSFISGTIGQACANTDICPYRGCSTQSCVCFSGTAESGIITAQGGAGGYAACDAGSSFYGCFDSLGFCVTPGAGAGCGTVCNYAGVAGLVDFIPQAAGGDVNCPGTISSVVFNFCSSYCANNHVQRIPLPHGFYSTSGGQAEFVMDTSTPTTVGATGQLYAQSAINSLGNAQFGTMNQYNAAASENSCTCYQMEGCYSYTPIGTGGYFHTTCGGLKGHGFRGGPGAVKIRYIPN